MLRKIDLMHSEFGTAEGKCKDCCHYTRYKYHNKPYRKCEVYGISCAESTDWCGKYDACGLFNKETKHENVNRLRTVEKKDIQIDGQMSLF